MSTEINIPLRELTQAKAEAAVQTRAAAGSRLVYVDNLRTFLTILVVLHHLAITYGASGSWYYPERPSSEVAEILLTMFTALNQFYFMGLFFLIAGYFVPGAVDRKGGWQYLKDRLVRLGIPLVLFALLASPFLIYINAIYDGWYAGTLKEFLTGYWSQVRFDSGPLWFVETLLVFSAIYVAGRGILAWLKREPKEQASLQANQPLTHRRILAASLALVLVTLAVRLIYPIGATWHNLQLAFFPQYILLFAAGIQAYRQNWLAELSERVRRVWSRVALIAMVILPVMMISIVMMAPDAAEGNLELVKGGLNPLSIFTAVWEAFYCLSMPVLLLSVFRKRFDFQGRLARFLSRNAYTAYIVHAPVIVFTALLFRSLALDPLLKFALVDPLGVTLTFLASSLVRRLPLADQVL